MLQRLTMSYTEIAHEQFWSYSNKMTSVYLPLHSIAMLDDSILFFPGLSSGIFQGFQDIQEIKCSGESLPQDTDVMFVVLYQVATKKVLATMKVNRRECTTSEDYNSCYISDGDSRKSYLTALISDLVEGQSRVYGCNVSALISGTRMEIFSWSIAVHYIPRKFLFWFLPFSVRCCSSCYHVLNPLCTSPFFSRPPINSYQLF